MLIKVVLFSRGKERMGGRKYKRTLQFPPSLARGKKRERDRGGWDKRRKEEDEEKMKGKRRGRERKREKERGKQTLIELEKNLTS